MMLRRKYLLVGWWAACTLLWPVHGTPGPLLRESQKPCTCADLAPPEYSCQHQRDHGQCNSKEMLKGGFCAATCQRCVCFGDCQCVDRLPASGQTCLDVKESGGCYAEGIVKGNLCSLSCRTCPCLQSLGPDLFAPEAVNPQPLVTAPSTAGRTPARQQTQQLPHTVPPDDRINSEIGTGPGQPMLPTQSTLTPTVLLPGGGLLDPSTPRTDTLLVQQPATISVVPKTESTTASAISAPLTAPLATPSVARMPSTPVPVSIPSDTLVQGPIGAQLEQGIIRGDITPVTPSVIFEESENVGLSNAARAGGSDAGLAIAGAVDAKLPGLVERPDGDTLRVGVGGVAPASGSSTVPSSSTPAARRTTPGLDSGAVVPPAGPAAGSTIAAVHQPSQSVAPGTASMIGVNRGAASTASATNLMMGRQVVDSADVMPQKSVTAGPAIHADTQAAGMNAGLMTRPVAGPAATGNTPTSLLVSRTAVRPDPTQEVDRKPGMLLQPSVGSVGSGRA